MFRRFGSLDRLLSFLRGTAAGERGAELVPMQERRVVVVVVDAVDDDTSFVSDSVSLDD